MELNKAIKDKDQIKLVNDFYLAIRNKYSHIAPMIYLIELNDHANNPKNPNLPAIYIDVPAQGFYGLRLTFSNLAGGAYGGRPRKDMATRIDLWKKFGYKHFISTHLLNYLAEVDAYLSDI
jgi:hypothetical protein